MPKAATEFISQNPSKKPNPPKFLEVTDSKGTTKIIKVGMHAEPSDAPQLSIIQPDSLARKSFPLVSSVLSAKAPSKSFDQPPHRFHSVDSKSDSKAHTEAPRSTDYLFDGSSKLVPKFVGSTFHHLPNAPTIIAPPVHPVPRMAPSLPRPYISAPPSSFDEYGLLHNRTAHGKILGKNTRKYCDEAHVPYHPEPQAIAATVTAQGGKVIQSGRIFSSHSGRNYRLYPNPFFPLLSTPTCLHHSTIRTIAKRSDGVHQARRVLGYFFRQL